MIAPQRCSPAAPRQLNLGRYNSTYGLYFNSSLDEVAVYPTALNAARVQAHFSAATTSTTGDPVTLDGAILRVDPVTGAAFAGNPFAASADPNKQRIIAYGLRNPFPLQAPPRHQRALGRRRGLEQLGRDQSRRQHRRRDRRELRLALLRGCRPDGRLLTAPNLDICENLYAAGSGAITAPVYTYAHSGNVVAGETCPTGGSAIAGMAFYPRPVATSRRDTAVDCSSRTTIAIASGGWPRGPTARPDPATRAVFLAPAADPVDLEIGPDGALYYVDFDTSTIRKVAFSSGNQPPTQSSRRARQAVRPRSR